MGDFTQVKSPMNFHGGFYPSGNTLDYKMTHWLFTLFQIISNILTSSLLTFSVIYTFYFYIAFEELTFYQKCSIKCVLYSLFYTCTVHYDALSKGMDEPISHVVSVDTENTICMPKTSLWVTIIVFLYFCRTQTRSLPCLVTQSLTPHFEFCSNCWICQSCYMDFSCFIFDIMMTYSFQIWW